MFSIITPTFNRAHTLQRVFDSLKSQTLNEFHWIIIDDASNDNTKEIVNVWLENEKDFKIEYHRLDKNKGKPFALNFGLNFCTEPITIIADSDDSFTSNTLTDLKQIWSLIDTTSDGQKIGSVWTLVNDEDNNLVGEKFPKNFWQVGLDKRILERKKPVAGEKWHSWRTPILKKYKMYYNENAFIGESATWHNINKDYDFLCLNIVHRIYYFSEDGLINEIKTKLKIAKIRYYTSYYQLNMSNCLKIISINYYRNLAFEYTKSNFYYSDFKNKLPFIKRIICFVVFIYMVPRRLLSKL